MDNKLGKFIKSLRLEKGMSLREFGNACGISHTHIDSIEKGADPRTGKTVKITNDVIEKIANAFNLDPTYLFELSLDRDPELSEKDEKDIAKTMEKLKEQLSNDQGLMFDGDILDEDTARLLLEAIEQQERMIKKINKKYTPNKYKK